MAKWTILLNGEKHWWINQICEYYALEHNLFLVLRVKSMICIECEILIVLSIVIISFMFRKSLNPIFLFFIVRIIFFCWAFSFTSEYSSSLTFFLQRENSFYGFLPYLFGSCPERTPCIYRTHSVNLPSSLCEAIFVATRR